MDLSTIIIKYGGATGEKALAHELAHFLLGSKSGAAYDFGEDAYVDPTTKKRDPAHHKNKKHLLYPGGKGGKGDLLTKKECDKMKNKKPFVKDL